MPHLKVVCLDESSDLQHRFFSELPSFTSIERLGITSAMSEAQDPIENLTPDEANRIIHSHRKVRYGKQSHPTCGVSILIPHLRHAIN